MKHAKLTTRELMKRLNYCWRSIFRPIFSGGKSGWQKPIAKSLKVVDPCDINAIKADKMAKAMEEDNVS